MSSAMQEAKRENIGEAYSYTVTAKKIRRIAGYEYAGKALRVTDLVAEQDVPTSLFGEVWATTAADARLQMAQKIEQWIRGRSLLDARMF